MEFIAADSKQKWLIIYGIINHAEILGSWKMRFLVTHQGSIQVLKGGVCPCTHLLYTNVHIDHSSQLRYPDRIF